MDAPQGAVAEKDGGGNMGIGLWIAAAALAALNLVSFCLMAADKRRAKKGKWRIPEKTLFLAAGCFGALGGVLGMFAFRHKTKHWYFRLFLPLMLAAQIGILIAGYVFFVK